MTPAAAAVLDAPRMEVQRLVKVPVFALCLLSAGACSSSAPGTTPTDAGVDAGQDVDDVPLFRGPGSLNVTWTINGMPPSAACAAAGADRVELQLSFGGTMTFPCTQGTYAEPSVPAGNYNIGANLLRADGTAIYRYAVEAAVQSDQATSSTIDFSPPGRLRVRWTVNGATASATCATTTASVVQVEVRLLGQRQASCTAGTLLFTAPQRASGTPAPVMEGVQPGHYTVTGQIFHVENNRGTLIQRLTGEVDVPSGDTGEVTLPFEAPPAPMMP